MRNQGGNDDDPPLGLTQEQVDVLHRARVMYAFIDVLADRGYAATTVSAVASRAMMSSRTFYRLYGNKADAYADMHRRISTRARDCMCAAMARQEQPRDKLGAALDAVLTLVDEQPELGRAFVADGPAREGGVPAYLATLRGWVGEVDGLLPEGGMSVEERAAAIGGLLRVCLVTGTRPASEMLPVVGHLLLDEPVDRPPPRPVDGAAQAQPPLTWDVVLGALADGDVATLAAVQRQARERLEDGVPEADADAAELAAIAEVARAGTAGGLPAVLAILGHGQGAAATLPSRQAVRCLRYIAANPGVNGREVLRGLGFRNESQVSRLLSGLASRGLVDGPHEPGGSRRWTITEQGRAMLEQHFGG